MRSTVKAYAATGKVPLCGLLWILSDFEKYEEREVLVWSVLLNKANCGNIKLKFLKTNACIWYKMLRRIHHWTPEPAHLNIKGGNKRAPSTKQAEMRHHPQSKCARRNFFLFILFILFFIFSVALRPKAGHGLLIHEVSRSRTTTRHSR